MSPKESKLENVNPANLDVIESLSENPKWRKYVYTSSSLNNIWKEAIEGNIERIVVARENLSQVENFTHVRRLTIWNNKAPPKSPPSAVKKASLVRRNGKKSLNGRRTVPEGFGCLSELKMLEFAGEKGAEIDMRQVGLLTGLTALDLNGCVGIDYNAMEVLATLKDLEVLVMAETDAGDKCLEFMPNLVNLRVLDISKCFFGTLGMKSVGMLSSLRKLALRNTHMTYRGLEVLEGLTELQDLDLHGCELIGDEEMKIVGRFYQLRRLMLGDTGVGDDGVQHLVCLRDLGELELSGCKRLTDAGLIILGWFKNLGKLDLSFTGVGNDGLEYLSGLENLRSLDLFMCQNVGDFGMQIFHSLTKIEELVLSRTAVGDLGLNHLAGLRRLRELELIGCDLVGNEGLSYLSGLECLKRIDFYHTNITLEGRQAMKNFLCNEMPSEKKC